METIWIVWLIGSLVGIGVVVYAKWISPKRRPAKHRAFSKKLEELTGRELAWIRPAWFSGEYELTSGGDVVALLRWKGGWPGRGVVIAESVEGNWTFKLGGWLAKRVVASRAGSDYELAKLETALTGRGAAEFVNGRRFQLDYTNFFCTESAFKDEKGSVLVRFKRGGFLRGDSRIHIETAGASVPELPVLVLLGSVATIEASKRKHAYSP